MLVLKEMLHSKLRGEVKKRRQQPQPREENWSGMDWRWKRATDFFMWNKIRMMESNYADVVIMQIDSMSRQCFTFVLISRQMNAAKQSRNVELKLWKKNKKRTK